MSIARKEEWKVTNCHNLSFDKDIVFDYFAKKQIAAKYVNWKQIVDLYGKHGVSKENVFALIHEQRWKPVTTTGNLWTFEHAPIAEYFASLKDKYFYGE